MAKNTAQQDALLEELNDLDIAIVFAKLDYRREGKDGVRYDALKFSWNGNLYFLEQSCVMQNSKSVSLWNATAFESKFDEITLDNVEEAREKLRLPESFIQGALLFNYVEIDDKDFSEEFCLIDQDDETLLKVVSKFIKNPRLP